MNPQTLHKVSYGLYIICSAINGKKNGQIANAVFQVTSSPPTIAISINKQNLTHQFIDSSGAFTVSILNEQAPMPFIGTFGFKSGRNTDKFAKVKYKIGKTKIPIVLDYTVAYLEARVTNKVDVGTHTIFIGTVEEGDTLRDDPVMTYDYYHKVKGGFSPKTAPTYSGESDIKNKETKGGNTNG